MTDSRIDARRTVDARADDVFALLATPARHVEFDASGTVRGCPTPRPLQGVDDLFVMEMHGADRGDYLVDNHVVAFESGREIAWASATHEGELSNDGRTTVPAIESTSRSTPSRSSSPAPTSRPGASATTGDWSPPSAF